MIDDGETQKEATNQRMKKKKDAPGSIEQEARRAGGAETTMPPGAGATERPAGGEMAWQGDRGPIFNWQTGESFSGACPAKPVDKQFF